MKTNKKKIMLTTLALMFCMNAAANASLIKCSFFNSENEPVGTFSAMMPVLPTHYSPGSDAPFMVNAVMNINGFEFEN